VAIAISVAAVHSPLEQMSEHGIEHGIVLADA
jgi:hypothetical protein